MSNERSLPLVLCGPMLRRVENTGCYVWLATSRESIVRLVVYKAGSSQILGESAANSLQTVKLGANLFVHLIRAVPRSGSRYPEDVFLEYDLQIDGQTLAEHGFADLSLPGFARPSFFMPSQSRNILVGSCRKPHGSTPEGDRLSGDALAHAWSLLTKTSQDTKSRPSTLLLLGDQIYADDVAGPLLESLKETSKLLMGADEDIPRVGLAGSIVHSARWEATYRIGLTTGHGEHHLLALGEYTAMYLAVYGGYYAPLPSWSAVESSTPSGADKQSPEEEYKSLASRVQSFLDSSQNVRRLLANVPSYAIFDDHEVTDDWNLDRQARDNVMEDDGAGRVVANALCAYWAFQGWGNEPDAFGAAFLRTVEDGLVVNEADIAPTGVLPKDAALPHALRPAKTKAREALQDMLLAFSNWHFVTPTNPPIIFLDTRTQRRYIGVLGLGQLVGPKGLGWLRECVRGIRNSYPGRPIYIAAVTPVIGFMPVEWLQGFGRFLFQSILDAADLDFESWIAQRDGYFELMRSLLDAGAADCVFLSGDVHYGFVKKGSFAHRRETCHMLQIVSSALHNEPANAFALLWLRIFAVKVERRVGFLGRQFKNKVRRLVQAFYHDPLIYRGLMKPPSTDNGQVWSDESEAVNIEGREREVIAAGHVVALSIENGWPERAEFNLATGGMLAADLAKWATVRRSSVR